MLKPSSPFWICEHCDTVHVHRVLARGEAACCRRCGSVLERRPRIDMRGMLAIAVTSLLLLLIANFWPVFGLRLGSQVHATTPMALIGVLWHDGFIIVAIIVLITLILAPLLRIGALVWLLAFAIQRRRAPGFRNLFITMHYLRPWTMIEVFVLGSVVSIVKSQMYFGVMLEPGIFAYAGLMLLITLYSAYDFRYLWDLPAESAA